MCQNRAACGTGVLHSSSTGADGCVLCWRDVLMCCVRADVRVRLRTSCAALMTPRSTDTRALLVATAVRARACVCSCGSRSPTCACAGTCLDSGTCARKAGVMNPGTAACSGLANNVQCCTSGTPAPTPTPRAACHYRSAGGHCSDLNECVAARGDLHSSASGASGCVCAFGFDGDFISFASVAKRSLPTLSVARTRLRATTRAMAVRARDVCVCVHSTAGVCMDSAYCAGTGKSSSGGATGCEAYPANIVCCFTGVANLEDEVWVERACA
jgi:hypothetical protein